MGINDPGYRPLWDLTENFDSLRIPVKESERKPGSYAYYGASGIIDWIDSYIFDGDYLLIAEDGENLRSRKTPVAFLANGKFWVNNHAHIVRGNKDADTRFLMYALSVTNISGYLTGSTIPKLTQENLNRIPIYTHPLPEQRAIADVLGSLDDKIELNRRMNATLESMARAVFKAWFVENEEAKGWEAGQFSDIAQNIRRGINPTDVPPEMPYIGLEHMPRRNIALSEWGRTGDVTSNKFKFKKGEILFGKLRPYFHKVGIAPIDGVCSTDLLVVTPKQPEYFGLVLGHISSVDFVNFVDAASEGTKMPRTNWETMARYPFALPDKKFAAEYTAIVRPMVEKIQHNIEESRTLAALRDSLLPRLMSGEVRVGR